MLVRSTGTGWQRSGDVYKRPFFILVVSLLLWSSQLSFFSFSKLLLRCRTFHLQWWKKVFGRLMNLWCTALCGKTVSSLRLFLFFFFKFSYFSSCSHQHLPAFCTCTGLSSCFEQDDVPRNTSRVEQLSFLLCCLANDQWQNNFILFVCIWCSWTHFKN